MKQSILFFVILFNSIFANSQTQSANQEQIDEVMLSIEAGDYLTAYELTVPLHKSNPEDPKLSYLLAKAAWQLAIHKAKAIGYMSAAAEKGLTESFGLYAEMLLANGQPAEAIRYLERLGENRSKKDELTLIHSKNAQSAVLNEESLVIERLGDEINTEYAEHTPLVSATDSVIYFTSRRPVDEKAVKDFSGQFDENIYQAANIHMHLDAAPLSGDINGLLNEATSAISYDAQEMLIFRTSRDLEGSDIWIAENRKGEWRWKTKLNKAINSPYIEQSATWNSDKNTFYFSSNRPGGFGGFDLYRVVRFANGDYSEPQNLGPAINSEHDEISPYLLPDDGTLFFSSNNEQSIGGFDFFRIQKLSDTVWSPMQNLGYPLSSFGDDVQLSLTWQGGVAYFSRAKQSNIGDLDIYKTNLPGFDLTANVFRISIFDFNPETEYDISLWTPNFEETLGYYYPNAQGQFIVVLMPGEAGLLEVISGDETPVELMLDYVEGEGIQEFEKMIKMKSAAK